MKTMRFCVYFDRSVIISELPSGLMVQFRRGKYFWEGCRAPGVFIASENSGVEFLYLHLILCWDEAYGEN